MRPAANANVGTKVNKAKPCAMTPPTLLQPAIQPVARPRSRTGKLSDVYGKRIEMTALVPTTKRETETSGFEIEAKARLLASNVAIKPTVVMPIAKASVRFVLQIV